ncbi:CysJI operon transcriptional activator [Phaeobacter sp. CECT 5382]|uniref:LysR family transcriptional regulator n=1 Tax=Phaeobacter sp. CECT 5382 TaxID=1712645 RepID=UPI0006DBA89D|nr:LysR family transcriptional regulator [Phaeobacter sp. CECT 5382]CUH88066.1 CysJI operon transcriptional activator [Phaeobacter sp. CECT 5382]
MRPNHHQFAAFAYVVREGSFSAAAARLGVTQSTVTQHVANLEAQVGSQLLIRGRDGVSTTRTGQEFFELADRLVALDTTIAERLQGFAQMHQGHLKIIANAPQPALRIIRDFGDRYPQVQVDFGLHDWTTATAMIRDRRADVGLITDPPVSQDWEMHKLQSARYVLYVRSDDPLAGQARVSLRDLSGYRLILPEKGSLTTRVVSRKLSELELSFDRMIRMTTFPVMCEAVQQGIGAAIFLNDSHEGRQGLAQLSIEELDMDFETWLVATKDRVNLRLIRAFFELATARY